MTDTANAVAVPAGLTLETFTQLVVAKQGVEGSLSNSANDAALLASSALWWNNLGPYFREEYLAQSGGALHVAFSALQGEPDAPPLLVITPEQDAAASASIANAVAENAAASAPVVPAPVAPVAPINPPKIVSVAGPVSDTSGATATVQTHKGLFEVVGEDVHDAIAKALAWIERGVVAIETGVRKL